MVGRSARGRHRALRRWRYQPESTYRDGALLLGLCSGLVLHAIYDAVALEETAWATLFTVFLAVDVLLYLHTCWLWFVSTGRVMRK